MSNSTKLIELSRLAVLVCEGAIDEEGIARLDRLLCDDPSTQRIYSRLVELNVGLVWRGSRIEPAGPSIDSEDLRSIIARQLRSAESSLEAKSIRSSSASQITSSSPEKAVPAVARGPLQVFGSLLGSSSIVSTLFVAMLTYGGFGLLVWQMSQRSPRSKNELELTSPSVSWPNLPPVARMVATEECRWSNKSASYQEGSPLEAGMLQLVAGTAELEFFDGARIVLHGPARFELNSSHSSFLHHGQLLARVPARAVGFIVATPQSTVVDLGTEFGMTVDEKGTTDVQVLVGRVEMRPVAGGDKQVPVQLAAGQARRIRASETAGTTVIETIPFDATRYAKTVQSKRGDRSRVDRNRQWHELLKREPSLLAYYPMNEPAGSTVALDAAVGAHHGAYRDGVIPGGVLLGVAGPRPKDFPAFASANTAGQFDGLRLGGGQEIDPNATDNLEITSLVNLSATTYSYELWFYCAKLDVLQYLGGRGQVDQFEAVGMAGGNLLFAGSHTPVLGGNAATSVTPDTWHHMVYTRDNLTIKVYLDGQQVMSDSAYPIPYGTSNRIVAGMRPDNAVAFAGLLDELAIYNTALSADEVRWHYQVSRP